MSEPTNTDRAQWAQDALNVYEAQPYRDLEAVRVALNRFADETGDNGLEVNLGDLLCDLFHLADRLEIKVTLVSSIIDIPEPHPVVRFIQGLRHLALVHKWNWEDLWDHAEYHHTYEVKFEREQSMSNDEHDDDGPRYDVGRP